MLGGEEAVQEAMQEAMRSSEKEAALQEPRVSAERGRDGPIACMHA